MALSRNQVQITWSSAGSVSVPAGGTATSDLIGLSPAAIRSQIQVKADHADYPAVGDTVEFWLLQTLGDPDGADADEYDTERRAVLLAVLDTCEDDPALTTAGLPVPAKGAKLLAKNNAAHAVTVSAIVLEQLSGP